MIKENCKDFKRFEEALALVKNEKQVLILLDHVVNQNAYEIIVGKLPLNSYTEHFDGKTNTDGAAAWIEHHLTRQEKDGINEKFKFIIADWWTTAGYEVPAVIFITDQETRKRGSMATHFQ